MNTVIVKSQAEWDALPKSFETYTTIEVRTPLDVWLVINSIPESSHAELWESSHAVLRGSSHAELRGSSHAVLRESSHAELWGSSHAHHYSRKAPTLNGQSACHYYDGCPVPLSKSDRCIVIPVRRLTGNGGWLEENGVEEFDGSVVLFKRVSKDWLTQEGTPNETKWAIGSTVTHHAWAPLLSECGEGKFHACSRAYFCDEFRSTDGDRYIAIRVNVADLHTWDGGSYPHKIAFKSCVVLHECDRYGVEVSR